MNGWELLAARRRFAELERDAQKRMAFNVAMDVDRAHDRIARYTATERDMAAGGMLPPEHVAVSRARSARIRAQVAAREEKRRAELAARQERRDAAVRQMVENYRQLGVTINIALRPIVESAKAFAKGLTSGR